MATWSGFVYTAFVIDVHSRKIVGWRTAATMTTPLVMDALNMAVFSRRLQLINGVIAHSDAGSQGGFQLTTSSPQDNPPRHHYWGNFAFDYAGNGYSRPVYARFSNAERCVVAPGTRNVRTVRITK